MSKIDELLKNEKVEWKKLGEIGYFFGGLTGKTKEDFGTGNSKYVPYKNIFSNIEVDLNNLESVNIGNEKQNELRIGDILFTGSSEIMEECGLSSVITEEISGIYLNSFSFAFRLNDDVKILPSFSKYLFRDFRIRKQIIKTANGVTRFNVSKEAMKKIEIPIPSIETQEKIVKTLDKFTNYVNELQAELQAELQSRTKQYEYYRDMLLSEEYLNKISKEINGHGKGYEVKVTTLGECVNIILGGTPNKDKNEYWDNGTIPWMSSGEVNKKTVYNTNSFITQKGYDNSSATMVPKNSTVIALAGQGKTRGLVARIKIELTTNQSLATLIPSKNLNNDYLYYYLTGQYLKLREVSSGDGSRGGLNKEILKKYQILVPSVKVQERIVSILDKFDSIVNDISKGLPKEIELRQKQYEHYREKLLTFEK